ncbi:hypothetical protein L1987_21378 [Smallanthus sonchifolius]|uniref:Uncharacterized protein n=1 Tax=Smallanthus sonchifolius TaxID=185202 RepID=A0ACB9IW28_9ASTR|nr:hypothetical protein L1987_21378 [Smallanthus sonchifolius]
MSTGTEEGLAKLVDDDEESGCVVVHDGLKSQAPRVVDVRRLRTEDEESGCVVVHGGLKSQPPRVVDVRRLRIEDEESGRRRGGNGCKVKDDNASLMLMWEDGFYRGRFEEMDGCEDQILPEWTEQFDSGIQVKSPSNPFLIKLRFCK